MSKGGECRGKGVMSCLMDDFLQRHSAVPDP